MSAPTLRLPLLSSAGLLLFIVASSVRANAAVLVHLTLEDMTSQSSAIFLGRCVNVHSQWNSTHTSIVTQNVFEVSESYKGSPGSRVTITEFGGQVGDWVADFPGMPRFQPGEESLLFVWTGPDGQHQVIGLTQGKFGVERNSQTGEVMLRQALSGEPMMEPRTHTHSLPAGQLAMPLGALKDRVALINRTSQVGR